MWKCQVFKLLFDRLLVEHKQPIYPKDVTWKYCIINWLLRNVFRFRFYEVIWNERCKHLKQERDFYSRKLTAVLQVYADKVDDSKIIPVAVFAITPKGIDWNLPADPNYYADMPDKVFNAETIKTSLVA